MTTYYLTQILADKYKKLSDKKPNEGIALANEGWIVGKNVFLSSVYKPDVLQDIFSLETTFFNRHGYRIANPITGTFDVGEWILNFKVKSNVYFSQQGYVKLRLWKDTNADGITAIQLTPGWISSPRISFIRANQYVSSVITWNSPYNITLKGEYIFLEIEWFSTVNGENDSATVYWITGKEQKLTTPKGPIQSRKKSIITIGQSTHKIGFNKYYDDTEDYVEIGDITSTIFKPHAKLKRWGDECYLSVSYPTTKNISSILDNIDNKVLWKDIDSNIDINFYGVDKSQYNNDNSFEYEVILNSKPVSNIISLDIDTKNLDFFYQPALTQEDIDNGHRRSDNIIGSYAVYHSIRTNFYYNQTDADKYKTGKAFHIYRPKVIDANGNSVWADLNIDIATGKMTITISQTFLDSAIYPVIVDPTFGYTTAGASVDAAVSSDYAFGSVFTSPSDAGTVTSISVYGMAFNTSGYTQIDSYAKGFITGTTGTYDIVSNTVTGTMTMPYGSRTWYTANCGASATISSSTDYVICAVVSGNYFEFSYDTGTNLGRKDTTNSFATPQNLGSPTTTNLKYSIYATYTATSSSITQSVADTINISEYQVNCHDPILCSIIDTINISEIAYGNIPQVFIAAVFTDNINISENVNPSVIISISIADTTNISENVSPSVIISISIADTTNISENVSPNVIISISIADTTNISENVTDFLNPLISSIFDNINISEDLTDFLNPLISSIFDNINISENVSPNVIISVSIADTTNISENVTDFLNPLISSIFDNINISENLNQNINILINIADLVNISENVNPNIVVSISLLDNVNISENVNPNIVVSINLADLVNISENITDYFNPLIRSIFDTINISDNVNTGFSGIITIVLTDNINVSEDITDYLNPLIRNIFDTINISEDLTDYLNPLLSSIFDTINVSDNVALNIADISISVSISDNISVSDNVNPNVVISINLTDLVNTSDNVTDYLNPLIRSIFDSINVSDNVTDYLNPLIKSIFDNINISEIVSGSLPGTSISVVLADNINVSDNVSASLVLKISSNDVMLKVLMMQQAAGY